MTVNEGRSGLPGYRGFEYQIEATVWVSLDMMLGMTRCDELVVEPTSAEDLELTPAGDDALSTVTMNSGLTRRLLIQFKTRSTGPWSQDAFSAVIGDGTPRKRGARGPAPRELALEILLKANDTAYVLVTNAFVDSKAHWLTRTSLLEEPKAAKSPTELLHERLKARAAELTSRVSILPGVTAELVEFRTAKLLSVSGKVPHLRIAPCIGELKNRIRDRLLGRAPALFTRKELLEVLKAHGGVPGDDLGTSFFPPVHFERIQSALAERNVLFLVGPPGVGKTTLARHLAELHRREHLPFQIHFERESAGSIINLVHQPGPALFVVSDPWGVSDNKAPSPLTHELAHILESASADKRFVITSRNDVYAGVNEATKLAREPFVFSLSTDSYHEDALWGITTSRFSDVPGALAVATRFRSEILSELKTPFELHMFGSLFRREFSGHQEKWQAALVGPKQPMLFTPAGLDVLNLIRRTGSAGTGEFARQVLAGWKINPVEHVAVCWLLVETFESVVEEELLTVMSAVGELPDVEMAPKEFLGFLVDYDLAELRAGVFSIHSFVLKGMRGVVGNALRPASAAIKRTVDHYLSQASAGDLDSSVGRAIRAIHVWEGLVGQNDRYLSQAIAAIDQFLEIRCLLATGKEFIDAVFMAMSWNGSNNPFVRFVGSWRPGETDSTPPWFPPKLDDSVTEHVIATGQAARFLPRFVAEVIPNTSIWYGYEDQDFVDFIKKFNVDLGQAAREALRAIHDRMSVQRGDETFDSRDIDINVKPLKALLAAFPPLPPESS